MAMSDDEINKAWSHLQDEAKRLGAVAPPEPSPEPSPPSTKGWFGWISSVVMWSFCIFVAYSIFGVSYNRYQDNYDDRINFSTPFVYLSELVRPDAEPVQTAEPVQEPDRLDWDSLTFEQKAEYRRSSWDEHDAPKVLARLPEFKAKIDCNINLRAMPEYGNDSLWRSDVEKIRAWYQKEEERLHNCIKDSIWDGETAASNFLITVFLEVMPDYLDDDVLDQFRYLFSTDEKIQEAYQTLLYEWQTAQSEKYAENTNKWNNYSETVLRTAVKRGGREERAYDRRIAKEEADREFEEQHGMHPDDDCQFEDERGRIKFRGKCRDYVKQSRRLMNSSSGWSTMWEEIGEQSRAMERKRIEKQRAEQEAYFNLLLLQSEVNESNASEPSATNDGDCMGCAKHPGKRDVCHEVPPFGEFDGDRAYAESQKLKKMSREKAQAYEKQKRDAGKQQYKDWYENTSPACQGQWGTPGAKSTPSKGISK